MTDTDQDRHLREASQIHDTYADAPRTKCAKCGCHHASTVVGCPLTLPPPADREGTR